MMNLEKHIKFIVEKLNLLGPEYIHKIDRERKWAYFKEMNIEECLEKGLYVKNNSQYNRYHNKRTKQFRNIAKLLLINEDFVNDILKISDIFQLNNIAFGVLLRMNMTKSVNS